MRGAGGEDSSEEMDALVGEDKDKRCIVCCKPDCRRDTTGVGFSELDFIELIQQSIDRATGVARRR